MLKLDIPTHIFEQMAEQARTEAPIEACGILAGMNGKAQKIYRMTNADHRGDHFMMEPREQFAVVRDIRSSSLELLAIYHSHPETPARPSAEDIRLALTPNVVYVILSLQNGNRPALKGFRVDNGTVTDVPVEISHK
ncbi:MAG: M67 family metallopeptidase [Planctomycetota bacterium]